MTVRRVKGMTLIGFLISLVIGLFFAYAAMILVPTYLEYNALTSAMSNLEKDPASKGMAPNKIKQKIQTSLWVSYASDNIQLKHMRVSKVKEGVKVRVKYEVRKPFLGNVDLVAKFDHSVILR